MVVTKPAPSSMLAPEPPYYAVIFTSTRTEGDGGYDETAVRMVELARGQPGFLGVESARGEGVGITVSYWRTEEAILRWKRDPEHRKAQADGRRRWYGSYSIRVAKVERQTFFSMESRA